MADKHVWREATIEDVNNSAGRTEQMRAFLAGDMHVVRKDFADHAEAKRERNALSAAVHTADDLRDRIVIKLRGNTVFLLKCEVE